ncbi:hypothetical protein [Streptomyces sp. NPDC096012]|uniref:hypothetical protein n=1 Tax=Streptomyces sp. NPDC096012 TaxID=3155684 RepID=UPI00336AA381
MPAGRAGWFADFETVDPWERYCAPIAALRRAQTQLMDAITGAHWAAFVLQGRSTG